MEARDATQQQWREMFNGVCNYVGDDPLLPWLRIIKWARDTLSCKTKNADLSNLLETCISIFEDDERYRNDLRFLKLWILYADSSKNYEQVYAAMEEKGIGRGHSLFYEAYATHLELHRQLCHANDVYLLGLSRRAEPLASLKDMYTSFLNRMVDMSSLTLHKDQKQCGSFNKGVLTELESFDNSNQKAWNSVPAPDTKFLVDEEFRQRDCARQDYSFRDMQTNYSTDHGKCKQEISGKSNQPSQTHCGNDVPFIVLDREEYVLEETRSTTLSNITDIASESISVESQKKKEMKSLLSDGRRPGPSDVLVDFEDGVLCNRNNVQENHASGQHVLSSPVNLTQRIDIGDSSDLHVKNGYSAPVQGVELHETG